MTRLRDWGFTAIALTALMTLMALRPLALQAQTYPAKTVRIIVPFTPGGGTDFIARLIGAKLSSAWGQQFVVENRVGAGSTLVLLNGRRIAPHPITSNDGGVPAFYANVNQLPTQGLERIDVLRDGASSIYGSDAVAGVINYVTRRDFRGTDLRLRLGAPEHGGGENLQVTLTHGRDFAGGKGRLLMTFDYFWRDEIAYRERSFTRFADHTAQAPAGFNAIGGSFDGRSAVSIYPSFRIGTGTTANFLRPINGALTFTTSSPTASVAAPPVRPNNVCSPISFASPSMCSTVTGKPRLVTLAAVAMASPFTFMLR